MQNRQQGNKYSIISDPENEKSIPKSNAIKINSRKLPSDFFSSRKSKLQTASTSHKSSSRNSEEKYVSKYSSTIPLAPSFSSNKNPQFASFKEGKMASIQLVPYAE
jgi:hypothetical protein